MLTKSICFETLTFAFTFWWVFSDNISFIVFNQMRHTFNNCQFGYKATQNGDVSFLEIICLLSLWINEKVFKIPECMWQWLSQNGCAQHHWKCGACMCDSSNNKNCTRMWRLVYFRNNHSQEMAKWTIWIIDRERSAFIESKVKIPKCHRKRKLIYYMWIYANGKQ